MDDYRQGIKHGIVATLLVCAVFAGIALLVRPSTTEQKFGGTTTSDSLKLRGTLTVDGATTLTGAVSMAGALSAAGQSITASTVSATSSLTIGSGTAIDFHKFATTTVNPNSIAAGGSTTTVVTLTGVAANDMCTVNVLDGDLWSTTSTAVLSVRAGTNQATVNYYNATSTSAFDAGSSTLGVQCWSH